MQPDWVKDTALCRPLAVAKSVSSGDSWLFLNSASCLLTVSPASPRLLPLLDRSLIDSTL